MQVRSERKYHGLVQTVVTVWKVSLYPPIQERLADTLKATRNPGLLRRRNTTPLPQSPQLRHWMGGIRGRTHGHAHQPKTDILTAIPHLFLIYLFVRCAYICCRPLLSALRTIHSVVMCSADAGVLVCGI